MTERSGHSPRHDELRDDIAAYALGALEDREAERLRVHLETCEGCRRHLRWLEPAVALLPRTVEQLEPPARLRDSLMDAVRAESPPTVEPPRRATAGWWRGLSLSLWRPATAAAAAVMLMVGLVAGYLVYEPGGSSTSTLEAQATPAAPHVTGVLEQQNGSGILRVQGMPSLARDQVYEVWVQRDGKLEPSSLFVPRRNHSADAAVPGSLSDADAVLVTKEPRGGSRQPTTSPLLSVQLD